MDKLVERLNGRSEIVSTAALYNAQAFSRAYLKSEFPKLRGLTFSQVSWIVSIDNSKRREWYRRQCLKHKWSSRQLQAEIQEEFGKRSSGGAPFAKGTRVGPRTAPGRWLWLRDVCQNKCVPAFEQNFNRLTSRKVGNVDPKLLDLMDEASLALAELSNAVNDLRTKLRKARAAFPQSKRS